MDEKESNIVRLEGLKEDFESALEMCWFVEARAALKEMEEMLQDTYELRRSMNLKMAEMGNTLNEREKEERERQEDEEITDRDMRISQGQNIW